MKRMKQTLLAICLIVISQSLFAQVINSESFDGTTFAPAGWITAGSSTYLSRVTVGSSPTQAPHSGAGEVRFNSYSASSGTIAGLITPVFSLENVGSNTATVSFWMYRDAGYVGYTDMVEVLVNTTASFTGATSLGTVNRANDMAPVVASNGWYQYTFNVPASFSTAANYIVFRFTSDFGNNIFIDDVQWVSYPSGCTGAPAPGNTLASATAVCPGVNFTLSLQNNTIASGISYQWQSSSDGVTYADITGATLSTYSPTITVNTYFQCSVTCSSGPTTTISAPVQVAVNPFSNCYCTSNATSLGDEEILNVTIGTLNNSSTCSTTGTTGSILNEYSNFTNLPAVVIPKTVSTSFSVTVGSCGTYNYTSGLAIFIDFNQNGLFTDAGEKVYSNGSASNIACVPQTIVTGTFSIPLSALTGVTRMRIVDVESMSGDAITPCGTYSYGETEDYLVDIAAAPTCIQPSAFITSFVQSTSIGLSWIEQGSAVLWNVEYGATGFLPGTGAGTSVSGLTASNTIVSGLAPTTTYQFYVLADCGSGDVSYWTGPISVTTTCSEVATYVQNFDAVTTPAFPTCWAKVGTSGTAYTQTTNPSSTPNCVYMYSGSTTTLAVVAMQPVSNAGANTHQLRFNARASSTVGGILEVGYLTNPTLASSFVNIQSFTISTLTYQEYIAYPGLSVGSNATLAFRMAGSPANAVLIDDVNWEIKSTCPAPITPVISSNTTTTAQLAWTSVGTESSWEIIYGNPGFDPATAGTMIPVTTNPYVITGLIPSSNYDVYVRAYCGVSDVSTWRGPVSFYTLQVPATLPYVWNFDNDFTGFTVINTSQTNKWKTGTAVANSPARSAYISTDNGVTNTYNSSSTSIVHFYRDIQFPAGTYPFQLQFKWKAGGESTYDYINVHLVNTTTQPVAGTLLTTGQLGTSLNLQTSWQTSTTTIPNSWAGQTARLVFTWKNDGSGGVQPPAAIDDITLVVLSCPMPFGLTGGSYTQTSADINWQPGGTETSWDVQYGPTGFAIGTGTVLQNVTPIYNLTGLAPSTDYQFYVLAQCSASDSSLWAGPFAFSTACGSITATYNQNFDGVTTPTMPNCWNSIVVGASGTPTIGTSTTLPYSGTNCVQMYNATSVGSSTHLLLISPQFTDLTSGGKQVRFRARMTGTGTPVLAVGTVSSPTNQASFAAIQTFMDLTTSWKEYVIPFTGYVGANQYIAIKHGTGTTNQYIYIDNFSWELIPSCPWPTAFTAPTVEDVQATFNWTENGSATEWEIDYGPTGFIAGSGTSVPAIAAHPYTVTGLTATTTYQFYVRSICGPGDTSAWAGPLAITTTCAPVSVFPWTEGFESVTIPALPSCWFKENGDWVTTNNASTTYDADARTGAQFLRETYGATNEYIWTPGFQLTAGTSYDFSFWWAGDNYVGWAGDIFYNTVQLSTGATQLGTSFVVPATMTTPTYAEAKNSFVPTTSGIYYFAVRINCPSAPWYMSFDDFKLIPTPAHDLAVTAITSPSAECGLTNAETITIEVRNFGTQSVVNPVFEYKVNNGTVVSEPYTGTIASMGSLTYDFTATYDFTTFGTPHMIKAWSVFATDSDPTNDTATYTITPIASVTSITENFQSFNSGYVAPFPNGWTLDPATGYRWEIAAGPTSSTSTGPAVDHTTGTATGKYIYTEANSGSEDDEAVLSSTCLDLSSYTLPRLLFWYHFNGAEIGKMYVEVLSNNTWVTLDSIVGQQQLTETAPWLRKAYTLNQPAIQKIRFRAVKGAGWNYYGDLALDDIMIEESPANDLRMVSWDAPVPSGCGVGLESIVVKVQNAGTNSITNPGVAYQINGGAIVRDTIFATITSGQTYTFTYATDYDFSAPGVYFCKAFIDELSDTDHANDTLVQNVNSIPFVNTYPYVDGFEAAGSYWVTGGTNSTWEHGVPAGANITTAGSGTKVWTTSLTGTYNNSEASWVQGPCFDFSTIVNPIMILKINTYSESSYDGAAVEYSIDGGTTWQHLGAYNDQVNWYNDQSVNGLAWTGIQEGWAGTTPAGWRTAGHTLQPLIGQADVRFRLSFGSDASVNSYDGFAFDDFTITQAADLKPVAPYVSLTGCGLDADTIRMFIKNVGPVTVTSGESMTCKYIVNTQIPVSQTYALAANLTPGDSVLFTFTQPFAFASGNYTVKLIVDYGSDFNGNNDTTQYLISQQNIQVQILGGDTLLVDPTYFPYTLSLVNLGYTYDSYSWSDATGSVTGTTNTFDINALGWYYLTVTNTNCEVYDSIFVENIVSNPFISNDGSLSVYPNPARDIVYFDAKTGTETDLMIQLVTPDGKVIETKDYKNITGINTSFNTGKLAKGLYFIKVYHGNSCYIEKISIE